MGINSFQIAATRGVHNVAHSFQRAQLYDPLPPKGPESAYIRVLDLHRDSKAPEEPLRGTLRVVNLRQCPRFAALSYVWGEYSEIPSTIHCGRHEFPITKNCDDSLRSLRALYGPITIWVDAICINQQDDEEKTNQIQLMEEIYTWAHTVFAWLGKGNEQTDRAMRCLKMASVLRLSLAGIPWTDGKGTKALGYDKFVSSLELMIMFLKALIPFWQRFKAFRVTRAFDKCDLDELLNRDWILRAWTYQEIVLASNPVILCGGKAMAWSRLQRGLSYFSNPVTPFSISLIDIVRASFTYQGPRKTLPPGNTGKVYDDACSLKSFHTWTHMHEMWDSVYRPSCWNGRRFRKLPRGDEETTILTHSAKSYQNEHVNLNKTWHYARLIIALTNIFGLPTVIALLVLLVPQLLPKYHWLHDWIVPCYYSCDISLASVYLLLSILFPSLWGLMGVLITVYTVRTAPRQNLVDDGDSKAIVGLVQALRERQATVPADKAFSLRGVLDRLKLSTSIPGYNKSYGQVYHNLFLDLLRHDTHLVNLLIDVGPRLPGVPSWVPDWSSVQERSWIDVRHVHDHSQLYGASFPEPQMKIAKETLGLWSIAKGSVGFCSSLVQKVNHRTAALNSLDDAKVLDQMVGIFVEWVHAINNATSAQIGHDQEDVLQDMYNVLMGQPTTPCASDLDTFKRWLHIIQDQSTDIPEVSPILSAEDMFAGDAKALEFTIKCYNQLAGKRALFITQDGKLGTGPCGMAFGDRLTLLRGVAVPMIIRRTSEGENKFEVVGPAFVSPEMDVDGFNRADFGHDWESVYLA